MKSLFAAVLLACSVSAQSLNVGLLFQADPGSRHGILFPASVYNGREWRRAGARNTPPDWILWTDKLQAVPIRITGPCEVPCAEMWVTDFVTPKVSTSFDTIGLATSPGASVVMFDDQAGIPRQQAIQKLLEPAIQTELDAYVAKNQLHPTQRVTAEPMKIVGTRQAVNGENYYHVRYSSDVYDQKAAESDCKNFVFLLEAWLAESSSDGLSVVAVKPQWDDCYGANLVHTDPVGLVIQDKTAFAVARENYYESLGVALIRLDPRSAQVATRKSWSP